MHDPIICARQASLINRKALDAPTWSDLVTSFSAPIVISLRHLWKCPFVTVKFIMGPIVRRQIYYLFGLTVLVFCTWFVATLVASQ